MANLILILGDQLNLTINALAGADKAHDQILMCEVCDEATYVKHHKKKIAFIFSAMRHFAQMLETQGYQVHYTTLDDPNNTGSLGGELQRVYQQSAYEKLIVMASGEYRVDAVIAEAAKTHQIALEVRTDNRFLCTPATFSRWAQGKSALRMEYFYREMRKKYQILMTADGPVGGQWNYDAENRKVPSEGIKIPKPTHFKPDEITQQVLALVAERFSEHFGDLEPFYFAVTRKQALSVLKQFIQIRLPTFGDYQDAMLEGEPWMYHSHLSFYLNIGLLMPHEVIKAAEKAYHDQLAPLNAVEGFIRQILGWREFIRGIYWLKMPDYYEQNALKATRPLPDFFWDGHTKMNCLKQCITETKENAYAHHIQRLMVLGNFLLLAGIAPKAVSEWYLLVYADAYEWVELPNVIGMILYADDGFLASKPYAASGAYIDRMSNYCKSCHYQVKKKNGEQACPFNYLYWDFFLRHQKKFEKNNRLRFVNNNLRKMTDEKKEAIKADAKTFFIRLEKNEV